MSREGSERKTIEELAGKYVVVDTSSLLVDGVGLLKALPDCSLTIPSVVVKELEEKRQDPRVGHLARQWMRLLEQLRVQYGRRLGEAAPLLEPFCEGQEITLKVEPNHSSQKWLPKHLQDGSNDSTVLAVAQSLKKELAPREVVLLSNDTPMRLAASLDLGLEAIEFSASRVHKPDVFDGVAQIEMSDKEYSNLACQTRYDLLRGITDKLFDAGLGDCSRLVKVVLSEDETKSSVNTLLYCCGELKNPYDRRRYGNIEARNLEQSVAMSYLSCPADELPIVSVAGRGGTGKTLITLACATQAVKDKEYDKIVVFRSLHEMGRGQELGYLPGAVEEKIAPWSGAVQDALEVLSGRVKSEKDRLKNLVQVEPITYLRGRSLANTYIILDEAQNFSRYELLNILSRAGQGSKVVLLFDDKQVDNKYLQTGINADVWSVVDSLKNLPLFAHITLKKSERSVVAEIASQLLEQF